MTAAGCNPCSLVSSGAGSTVTVTDSAGQSVTIVVRA
jgi:hypothetical protein